MAKEARLAAEKEAKEKKARDDAERKAKEAADKKEREEREEKERVERAEREAEAEREKAAAAAARAQAATAAAAARAKQQQQQTPKSPVNSRTAAPTKPHNIPGLPKAPVGKQGATSPVPSSPSQGTRSPSNLPPGVIPRQSSMSGAPTHQVPPHQQSMQQQAPQHQQRPAQQQQQPGFAQRQPSLNGVSSQPQSSRMFSPSPIGQPAQQPQLYGNIGMGQPQQGSFMPHPQPQQHPVAHISPVLGRNAPIGAPPSSSAPSTNGIVSPRPNGVPLAQPAPIAPPPTSSAAAMATSPRPINIGPIGGVIGRPSSSVSSQRSSSPPPRVFGSSALLEDDEIVVPQARSQGQQPQQQPSSSSDWSSPFSAGIWGAPALPTPIVTPDRNSVIRDRARVSYLKLDELSNGGAQPIAIGDIHRAMWALWPDSTSVE